MTPEEIIESKLIASYMDIEVEEFSWGNRTYLIVKDSFPDIDIVNYAHSWELLMPVVEKIEKGNYGFKICRKVVEIYFDDSKIVIQKTKEDCKLKSLYKAIVEFIKWHNQNKNK